ncbi:arylsulphatase A [Lentisphaera araneosa HTCC2155]|uniref:Arylsulphatase A n=1 Tax=Lentisphaera araneosa HTCC2155 TaxID=313628 RepID=A6DJ57_9BACT|nr:sulfatase [Lentisphaera araneosa]EDM28493.1 arylsulphatase A [Lentisphaera araneosa HTCC2155]
MKLILTFLFFTLSSPLLSDQRPNIVFVLIDDLGWNGLSSYGNKYVQTPHLDKLAKEGARFTDAYGMGQCSPARFAFLTGQSAARTNHTAVVLEKHLLPNARLIQPESNRTLDPKSINIGRELKNTGYRVGVIGKWHIDVEESRVRAQMGSPKYIAQWGFDHIKMKKQPNDPKSVMAYSQAVIDYLKQDQSKPTFAYLAHTTLHTALAAPAELIQKYVAMGYNKSPDKKGSWEDRPIADYFAMIDYMDQSIGLLMKGIEEMKSDRETLVIFMSDNGGLSRVWENEPLRRGKGSAYEGGIRVPLIMHWPERIKAGQTISEPVHITDLFPSFLSIADTPIPANHPLDGMNIMPLVNGGNIEREFFCIHMPVYVPHYSHTPSSVIRMGDYKLVKFFGDYIADPASKEITAEGRIELFNLRNDLGETKDLSKEMPEKAKEMERKLMNWLAERKAYMPKINPKFNAKKWSDSIASKVDSYGKSIYKKDQKK